MPTSVKEYFREVYSFYEYVLSGRINEIPENVTSRSVNGLCAHALYAQYHGNYSEALKIYRQALKYLSLIHILFQELNHTVVQKQL